MKKLEVKQMGIGSYLNVRPSLSDVVWLIDYDDYAVLKKDILKNGIKEPIDVWGKEYDIIDGRIRYRIARIHNIPFKIRIHPKNEFKNLDEVKIWMIERRLENKNLKPIEKSYMEGSLNKIIEEQKNKTPYKPVRTFPSALEEIIAKEIMSKKVASSPKPVPPTDIKVKPVTSNKVALPTLPKFVYSMLVEGEEGFSIAGSALWSKYNHGTTTGIDWKKKLNPVISRINSQLKKDSKGKIFVVKGVLSYARQGDLNKKKKDIAGDKKAYRADYMKGYRKSQKQQLIDLKKQVAELKSQLKSGGVS